MDTIEEIGSTKEDDITTRIGGVEDLAFSSDPHSEGMSFEELLDESTNAQKPVPEECSPVTLLLSVEEKTSRAGKPIFHVTGTVTDAADTTDPRNGKSIVGREVRFYLSKNPEGLSATEASQWVLGARHQLDIDIWPQDTGRYPDYTLLQGKPLTGMIGYSGGSNGQRPFARFRPEIGD